MTSEASPEIVRLLKDTVWGTKGPLYRHKCTEQVIHRLIQPAFFELEKDGQTIGTCNLSWRRSEGVDKNGVSCYVRYFSIKKTFQKKIYGHLLISQVRNYVENNIHQPTVFFAYLDEANTRSVRLVSRLGLEKLGNFETVVFSRIFPRKHPYVAKATAEDKLTILRLLKEEYSRYLFVNFDKVLQDDHSYILKKGEVVLAGVQVNLTQWEIMKLPGLSGRIIKNMLPYVPLLRRMINPGSFRYLGVDAVYCREGCEKELHQLLETVCSLHGCYSAMMWFDVRSSMLKRLKAYGRLGILNALKDDIPAMTAAGFKNVEGPEKEKYFKHPVYICSLDLI